MQHETPTIRYQQVILTSICLVRKEEGRSAFIAYTAPLGPGFLDRLITARRCRSVNVDVARPLLSFHRGYLPRLLRSGCAFSVAPVCAPLLSWSIQASTTGVENLYPRTHLALFLNVKCTGVKMRGQDGG